MPTGTAPFRALLLTLALLPFGSCSAGRDEVFWLQQEHMLLLLLLLLLEQCQAHRTAQRSAAASTPSRAALFCSSTHPLPTRRGATCQPPPCPPTAHVRARPTAVGPMGRACADTLLHCTILRSINAHRILKLKLITRNIINRAPHHRIIRIHHPPHLSSLVQPSLLSPPLSQSVHSYSWHAFGSANLTHTREHAQCTNGPWRTYSGAEC